MGDLCLSDSIGDPDMIISSMAQRLHLFMYFKHRFLALKVEFLCIPRVALRPEPVLLNVYGAPALIPRNEFRQPMQPGGTVRKPYSSSVPCPHGLFKNSSSDTKLTTHAQRTCAQQKCTITIACMHIAHCAVYTAHVNLPYRSHSSICYDINVRLCPCRGVKWIWNAGLRRLDAVINVKIQSSTKSHFRALSKKHGINK